MAQRKNASAADVSESGQAESPASAIPGSEAMEDEVRRAAAEYFDRLTEAAGRLTDQARHVYSLSHEYARDHPTGMIAGAFGIGLIVGLLLDRD